MKFYRWHNQTPLRLNVLFVNVYAQTLEVLYSGGPNTVTPDKRETIEKAMQETNINITNQRIINDVCKRKHRAIAFCPNWTENICFKDFV